MRDTKKILMLLGAAVISLGSTSLVLGDDDGDERWEHGRGERSEGRGWGEGGWGEGRWGHSRSALSSITNPTYAEECGACHMAYQPGLLPPQAWARIMDPAALASHYGDDASLSEDLRKEISTYLGAESPTLGAQTRSYDLAMASQANGSSQGVVLPRISETRDFRRKHDEIPARLVTGNPEVGSFSQCNKCHRGAEQGDYSERRIDIPGYGPWED